MPAELERRLREGRPPEPEFSPNAREQARMAALAARRGVAGPRRSRLRRLVRPARVVVGGIGFAALAGLIALLIVAGPRGRGESAGLRFADRPEGGVALHLRAAPIAGSGLSPRAAAEEAARVLLGRAQAQRIDGLEAVAAADGTLDAWVPVARTAEEVSRLLVPTRLRVYDLDRDLVARDPNARLALLRAKPAASRGPVNYYLVSGRKRGYLLAAPAQSRRALFFVRGRPPGDSMIISLPRDLLLARDARTGAWSVLRDRPVLEGADIEGIERRSWGLSLRPSDSGATRLANAAGTKFGLVYDEYASGSASFEGPLTIDEESTPVRLDLRAVTPWSRETLADNASVGTLAVSLSVLAEAPTGPPRVRRGRPVTQPELRRILALPVPLPVPLPPGSSSLVPSSVRAEVSAITPRFGEWTVFTGLTRRGEAVTILVDDSSRPVVVAVGGAGCQLTPQHPLISACASASGGRGSAKSVYGRVDERVSEVLVELEDGSPPERLTVANGWWLVVTGSRVTRAYAHDASGAVVGNARIS
jgi:hypothetical protein